jgi:pumilio RNA-binding family
LEESAKDGIVDELLNQGAAVFGEVAKNQWGSYCIQHSLSFLLSLPVSALIWRVVLEHGSEKHRQMTVDHLLSGLLDYASHEQGYKSVTKALKEGGKDVLDRVVKRMCEPAKGYTFIFDLCHLFTLSNSGRRAMIVDLALSVTGSQLIASVLPTVRNMSSRFNLYVSDALIRRRIRINGRFCTSASVAISLLFEAARPVLKLSGYCTSHSCPL